MMFGRLAAEQNVLVLNDPSGLAIAQNKLYLQDFPEAVRPATLISRGIEEIRAFIEGQPRRDRQAAARVGRQERLQDRIGQRFEFNQIFEAASGEGYLIAQAFVPEAKAGDVRLFLMNGEPLMCDGKYAAFRRVPAKGDVRSNIHAAGTATRSRSPKSCAPSQNW